MHDMSFALTDDQKALKAAVAELCKQYSPAYWQGWTPSVSTPMRSSTI
jgi:hypothetical protein